MTPSFIEKIMCAVNDPADRIVVHFVPSRAFRVITKDDKTFRVEQLSRQGGDKWVALSTHTNANTWEAFSSAWNDGSDKQQKFLLELRKLKVEQNQKMREAGANVL
jgi:hypothetical protein